MWAQPPPAELAASPDRAELWTQHHRRYRISGCGHVAMVACELYQGRHDVVEAWSCELEP
jgi:hypothetical protein